MPFDFNTMIGQAEDFLRRHLKPRAVLEAEKRRRQRRTRAALGRFNRGLAVTGAGGAGLAGYVLAVAPLGTAAIVAAGAATLVAAGAAALWPGRAPGGGRISRAELIALLADAEEWLLLQRARLPGRALPALDQIFLRLHDLGPHVPGLDPHATLAWDLRRLLADHLPRLVHNYVELPATVRDADPGLLRALVDGLATIDEELARICRDAASEHLLAFQAQERFLETRYRDAERLRSDRS